MTTTTGVAVPYLGSEEWVLSAGPPVEVYDAADPTRCIYAGRDLATAESIAAWCAESGMAVLVVE